MTYCNSGLLFLLTLESVRQQTALWHQCPRETASIAVILIYRSMLSDLSLNSGNICSHVGEVNAASLTGAALALDAKACLGVG
jgi:hypothetical protein